MASLFRMCSGAAKSALHQCMKTATQFGTYNLPGEWSWEVRPTYALKPLYEDHV